MYRAGIEIAADELSRDRLVTAPPASVPVRLPWDRPHTAPPPDVFTRTAADLDRFARSLSPREQVALTALINLADPDAPFAALAARPAGDILAPDEMAEYERLAAEPVPTTRALRPYLVLVMKATRLCNLRCTYCHFWRSGPNQTMRFSVLARTIRDALRTPGVRHVEFVWHGGEVTLLPIAFYQKALWLQQQFRHPGQTISNAIQTNGTRLTDEWLHFLKRFRFDVGVSLDGPPEIHDQRRRDSRDRPTAARVRAGLARLQVARIDHGVLLVVDDAIIAAGAERLLRYLLELGVPGVGLLNVIPANSPTGEAIGDSYLPWPRYVAFLRELFRLWWPAHAERIVLRELADLAGILVNRPAQSCYFAGDCFSAVFTIEPNGQVASCDKYIKDMAYQFGALPTLNLADLADSPRLDAVREANARSADRTRDCPWYTVCQGSCPHDRRLTDQRLADAGGGCCGLAPLLEEMAETLRGSGLPVLADGGVTAGVRPRAMVKEERWAANVEPAPDLSARE